jgi:carboxyl-terminal processing protease
MSVRTVAVVLFLVASVLPAAAQVPPNIAAGSERYAEDFDAFWEFVAEEYVYFDRKQTDWRRVRSVYRPRAATAPNDQVFLNVLEEAIGELYDSHAGFATNNNASPRLIPSGTDLWAAWKSGQPVVTDVRAGSAAEQVGLRPGMVVRTIGGRPVEKVVRGWVPRTLRKPDPAARDWALRMALAGTHAEAVRLTADADGEVFSYTFTPGVERPTAPLTVRFLPDDIGYVRVNNSLSRADLIAAFDSAMTELRAARGLILDLRDTPSGGNTTVARAIMGRLVETERPYQRHELPFDNRAYGVRRVWVEYVAPRGPFTYTRPIVVLVGRWTGSMGEGLAIGLDGMKRATVVGTPMARLRGAVSERDLPNTGIAVRIPTERLMHIDGTPRETFVPPVVVAPGPPGEDVALKRAVDLLVREP